MSAITLRGIPVIRPSARRLSEPRASRICWAPMHEATTARCADEALRPPASRTFFYAFTSQLISHRISWLRSMAGPVRVYLLRNRLGKNSRSQLFNVSHSS